MERVGGSWLQRNPGGCLVIRVYAEEGSAQMVAHESVPEGTSKVHKNESLSSGNWEQVGLRDAGADRKEIQFLPHYHPTMSAIRATSYYLCLPRLGWRRKGYSTIL